MAAVTLPAPPLMQGTGGGLMVGGGGAGAGCATGGAVTGGGLMVGGGGGAVAGGMGGAASGGGMCGCGGEGAGVATLSWVGLGQGAYIQETTYRYVGAGAGEFDVVNPKPSGKLWLYLGSGVGVLLLILVIVLLMLPGPTTTTTPGTTLPYDCAAGFSNWQQGWSISKKDWCCTNQQRGCTPTTVPPYNCDEGLANSATWTAAKKNHCCTTFNKGCAQPAKTCTLWGDPHIVSFDQVGEDKADALSFYGDGDFYIVKSAQVTIQGRFEGTKYTEGLAATNQVVVGGAFLKDHKIEVGTRDNNVLTVDGQAVFTGFPATPYKPADGLFTVTYDANGEVPDVIPEGNEKRIVTMTLPLGITVKVFQWNNYIDVTITMSPVAGQDGVCGNFNGVHSDDTTVGIIKRVGARVVPTESLLSGQAKIEFTSQMKKMMAAECGATKLASASAQCRTSLGALVATPNLLESCEFDECFGYFVRARSHAKTYA